MHDPITLHHGRATIIIHRPNLNERERAKRERSARTALAATMREYYNRKENTPCTTST